MWFFFLLSAASRCVRDKLADIVERTIQTEPAEAAQVNACPRELGWHSRAVLLSRPKWAGAMRVPLFACVHVTGHVCVFTKKARGGHGTDCTRRPHISPFAVNQSQQHNSGAPFCIHLPSSR